MKFVVLFPEFLLRDNELAAQQKCAAPLRNTKSDDK